MDQMMAALLQCKKDAELEKNLSPTPVVIRDRDLQIVEAAQARKLFEQSPGGEMKKRKATYIGLKNYSNEPIDNLPCVSFRDMFVRLVHKGKYVLCRTVSLPTSSLCISLSLLARVVAIELFAEDPSGDILPLSIYNFPLPLFANAQELDDIFPIGTLLAIREPYLKISLSDASRPFICVDSPTDLIFLESRSNPLQGVVWKFPSLGPQRPPHAAALECKLDGNTKFKGERWLAAAIAYTKGLSLTPSHDLTTALRLNRSESYLKLGYFSAALADAQLVLSDKALPQHSINLGKALLKAGKAHYFQDKFKEALESFMQLKNIPDGISEAKRWIDKTHLRISEQNNGDYDWYEMFKNSSRLEVADYNGPIEVTNLGFCSHGRGIIASRDISPGELLHVSKPFVSVFPDEFPESASIFGFDPILNGVSTTSQVAVTHKCIQKIYGNPSMKNLVYDLYVSAPHALSPDLYPPQMRSEVLHEPLRTSIDIDVSRVENICLMNTFSPLSLGYAGPTTGSGDPLADTPLALYLLPSIFNHSCYPNTYHFFLGDVMVVRALSKISKGDEVFLTYTGVRTYEKRLVRLKKWGFSCQCQLCQDDREEGADARAEREGLEAGIDDTASRVKSVSANIIELEKKLKQVKNTYAANRLTFKVTLSQMHDRLAWEFRDLVMTSKQHKYFYRITGELIQALKALGVPIIDDSINGNIHRKCDKIRAERWLRAAWLVDDITVGGGRMLFDECYKNILSAGILDIMQQLQIT